MKTCKIILRTAALGGWLCLTCVANGDEWKSLFNGVNLEGWAATGKPGAWAVEDGAIACVNPGSGGYLYTEKQYGDFVLSLEFKVSPPADRYNEKKKIMEKQRCNSGVFVRWSDLKDPVHTGLEVQIFDSVGVAQPGKHDCGAFYDLVPPRKNAEKPVGEWNRLVITARGPRLSVELNGEAINEINLDQFDRPGLNPDGSKNKFKFAWKNLPRRGHIGLQDHHHRVWFRDVKIKELSATPAAGFRIESEQNIFEPDSGPWSGGHAATIVQTTDGTILAAWRRDIDLVPNNETWMATYKDGRWSQPRILATGSESGDDYTLENVVLFQPKGGPLMLFYYTGPRPYFNRTNMWAGAMKTWGVIRTSTDNGQTWSPPRPLGADPRLPGGRLCGPTKNPPIQLPDGSILIPSSNEPGVKDGERDAALTWHFEKSTDMGQTWSVVQVLAPTPLRAIQPGFLVLGGGKLIALGRNEGKGNDTPMATSDDWGATWSGISGLAALPQSHSGIAPLTLRDGTHVCLLNTPVNPKNPRDRLDLMLSTNGLDWTLGLTLNPANDGKVANYPQVVQTSDGKLHIVFTYANQMNAQTWRERVIRHIVVETGLQGR